MVGFDCPDDLCTVPTDRPVTLRDTSSGTVSERTWDFGEGTLATSEAPVHWWSSPGFYRVEMTVSGAGSSSRASVDVLAVASDPAGACVADAETACMQDSRFQVEAEWSRPGEQEAIAAKVVRAGTNATGLFWFHDEANWEMLLKVLDGCAINGHVWVFGASATDLRYRIRVTDTATGELQTYVNAAGVAAEAIVDVTAFSAPCTGGGSSGARSAGSSDGVGGLVGWTVESYVATDLPARSLAASTGGCAKTASELCLQDGRYTVAVSWSTRDGGEGSGKTPRAGTSDSGLFYFFDSGNWEMLVKVLDGCGVNGHHWVFAASATDVLFKIVVTDTVTGVVKMYEKTSDGPAPAFNDVAAFPLSCEM